MTLLQAQKKFSVFAARLILKLSEAGYEITLGEALRPDALAKLYASEGKGIALSNHRIKLAIDLNLFKDGVFLTRSEQYREAGALWEAMSDGEVTCCWGGKFDDGNHFSFLWKGIR